MTPSFSTVFAEHYQSVFRLALSLSGSHADAEDIAQEVFEVIVKALPKFRGDSKLSTWIYRITLRTGTRWLARRGPVAELKVDMTATDQSIPIDLINVLNKLSLDMKAVVLLAFVEGLTHDEVAEVLAIPVGTVASRVHYARKEMVKLLGHP